MISYMVIHITIWFILLYTLLLLIVASKRIVDPCLTITSNVPDQPPRPLGRSLSTFPHIGYSLSNPYHNC
ncbi:hypothetical protein LIPSTDRAFT_155392 [Lipomyces starkeyi NRRL Y-11557]|uniref:Uncharacterized protein n=1 Tax=Lipomyces starkeyi NRRL Y-11557 TaxID=675824 RepID=A0A1E3PZ34_LIPST|nr:hypothetical protein LIPSTDRAFT_155392 [Lipomyces starkeyi NRRL Y-11557]